MENGPTWTNWIAYVVIVAFLLLLVFLLGRTMMMFGTLTLMPLSRIGRFFRRLVGLDKS